MGPPRVSGSYARLGMLNCHTAIPHRALVATQLMKSLTITVLAVQETKHRGGAQLSHPQAFNSMILMPRSLLLVTLLVALGSYLPSNSFTTQST